MLKIFFRWLKFGNRSYKYCLKKFHAGDPPETEDIVMKKPEGKLTFSNFLEVTAFIDAERIWSIIWIEEDFLLSLEEYKVIRFGNPDNFAELPIHEISDLENIRNIWNFYRNDDEWFKSNR